LKKVIIRLVSRKSLFVLIVATMLFANSVNAISAFASSSSSTTSNSKSSTSGKDATPPDGTYTYDPTTGNWVNGKYMWDPTTGQTTPLQPGQYTYDPTTGRWDSNNWVYDPTTGTYVAPAPTPPVAPTAPVPSSSSQSGTSTGTDGTSTTPQVTSENTPSGSAADTDSTSDTGPGSTNTITTGNGSNNDQFFDGYTTTAITNNTNADATSGNTIVNGNTQAGDSLSGDALSTADLINMVGSSSGLATPGYNTFVDNIDGDVNGDLIINPGTISDSPSDSTSDPTNVVINNSTNNAINNNIVLAAASGNSSVTGNTTAGNATTGSADAVANIVNLVNSVVGSNQSFIGEINIYGDLTGDIVIPGLNTETLASNTSDPSLSNGSSNLVDNNTDNSSIANNITSNAQSGNANVSNNTSAGNATTGTANTNVTLLNLTGKQVVAADSLLVFVNVEGTWIGLIMNAPAGSTSALVADGVTADNNTPTATNTTINNTTNNAINNNVSVSATSGNANVSNNTSAGNATSGDAGTAVNIFNLAGSDINLSGWFGILYINVFGQWDGSVTSTLAAALSSGNYSISTAPPSSSNNSSSNNISNTGPQSTNKIVTQGNGSNSNNSITQTGPSSINGILASYNSANPMPETNGLVEIPNSAKVSSSKTGSILLASVGGLTPLVAFQLVSRKRKKL
jgi:hypothetical protein